MQLLSLSLSLSLSFFKACINFSSVSGKPPDVTEPPNPPKLPEFLESMPKYEGRLGQRLCPGGGGGTPIENHEMDA